MIAWVIKPYITYKSHDSKHDQTQPVSAFIYKAEAFVTLSFRGIYDIVIRVILVIIAPLRCPQLKHFKER